MIKNVTAEANQPRCTGDCCRCFSLEIPVAELEADYARFQQDPGSAKIPQVEIIANMLIPLGRVRGQDLFTCKHLGPSGDCTIYETRPQMCRDFPGPAPCPYRNCNSHGPQGTVQRFWNWLRD